MTPEQMAKEAAEAMQAGTKMTLIRQRGAKIPPKFPRGELLCENFDGRNAYSYDPVKVLAWLAANGLVKVSAPVAPNDRIQPPRAATEE